MKLKKSKLKLIACFFFDFGWIDHRNPFIKKTSIYIN
jgi:hypothetical protein